MVSLWTDLEEFTILRMFKNVSFSSDLKFVTRTFQDNN